MILPSQRHILFQGLAIPGLDPERDDPYPAETGRTRIRCVEVKRLTYYGRNQPPPAPDPITKDQEHLAFIRYFKRKTRRDRELLIRQYLLWAFGMAAKFRGPRLCFDEAISVANSGLMEALNGFDPHKGYRFTTYATFVVRRHLIEAIVGTYPVHVSDHLRKKWRLNQPDQKKCEELLEKGEPRTLEEFFTRLGENPQVDLALLHEQPEDSPFVPSAGPSPAKELEDSSLPLEVKRAIRSLPKLERAALVARHYTEPPESFEETGRRLKVSKNRVREAYDTAVVHLRRIFSKES